MILIVLCTKHSYKIVRISLILKIMFGLETYLFLLEKITQKYFQFDNNN